MIPVQLVTHGVFFCSCCSGHSETGGFQGDPDFLPNVRYESYNCQTYESVGIKTH